MLFIAFIAHFIPSKINYLGLKIIYSQLTVSSKTRTVLIKKLTRQNIKQEDHYNMN